MKQVWAAVLACALATGAASACDIISSMPAGFEWTPSAREHVHRVDIVFEGIALGRVPEEEAAWSGTYNRTLTWAPVPTAFRVLRVWKGQVDPVVVVDGAPDWRDSSCWSDTDEFVAGERYLVFATLTADGALESPRGDLIRLLERERRSPGRPTELGWSEWQPSPTVANDWEATRERQQADWFEGAEGYRALLDRMVEEGALPEPYVPRRFGETERRR